MRPAEWVPQREPTPPQEHKNATLYDIQDLLASDLYRDPIWHGFSLAPFWYVASLIPTFLVIFLIAFAPVALAVWLMSMLDVI